MHLLCIIIVLLVHSLLYIALSLLLQQQIFQCDRGFSLDHLVVVVQLQSLVLYVLERQWLLQHDARFLSLVDFGEHHFFNFVQSSEQCSGVHLCSYIVSYFVYLYTTFPLDFVTKNRVQPGIDRVLYVTAKVKVFFFDFVALLIKIECSLGHFDLVPIFIKTK